MTIANTKASNVFNANGVTRDFNLGFVYDENVSGISIKVIDSEGTETEVTSNYTIYNGVLTYPTVDSGLDPLEAGYKITIERLTPHTQTIDLIQQGPLDAETLEGGYDKLTMEVQELQDASDRSIKFPLQTEGETDAQKYIDDLTDLKNTATSAATTATEQAGLATTAKNAAEAAQDKAEKWAEGTDAQVEVLGGEHSAKGWANISQTAAESEAVQTVVSNLEDINTVAENITDVRTVSSISNAVNTVATHDDEVLLVSDNMASVSTVASNVNDVNTVAAAASKVVTVADNISDVGTVADNAAAVSTVATDIEKVNTVATDIETIKAVNENKTNIDAVAGNATNINTVAADSTKINAIADDLTNIDNVADDLTNIDTVAASLPDIQDKQNKVLTNSVILGGETKTTVEDAIEAISEEWAKPADWPDIRSGALNNSVYFLVGHKADYSSYPKFSLTASVSTSANTYDVFVDGVKKATTANNTTTTLDWQTLALSTGFDVTHPSALRAHIVRITPTVSTDTLTATRIMNISGQAQQGALWLHFQLSNAIKITNLAGTEISVRNLLLEAITAKNDKITYTVSGSNSGLYGAFAYCESLVKLPILEAENTTYASGDYLNFRAVPAKKIVIKNNKGTENFLGSLNNTNIQELDVENGISMHSGVGNLTALNNATKLKHFPTFNVSTSNTQFIAYRLDSLENTVIDDSQNTARKVFRLYGTSTNPTSGLKGLTVSNVAPFDYATSPQINVSYTGLDRAALINLFNSLPTVTASQVCTITGATGANDLTAADLAIATGKGWTVTR